MTIYEQIKEVLKNKEGNEISSTKIKNELKKRYGTNPDGVLISDYCYNRTNDGIKFEDHPHLFEYEGKNRYLYIGENCKYSGKVFHKPIHREEREVGEWKDGVLTIYQ